MLQNPLLKDPKVLLYLSYRLLVTLAIQMQSVGVAWQIYEITHSPMHLGYVGLAIFVPNLLFALPGGRAADRYPRRRLMSLSVGLLLAASLFLWSGTYSSNPSVWAIYAILMVIGVARAYGGPSTSSYLPQLVAPEHLSKAIALNSTVFQFGIIAGPALAGFIVSLTSGSLRWLYAACALALGAALLGISKLPSFAPPEQQRELDLLGGLRFVWREKIVLGALSLDLFAVLLGGAVALLPIYAREILKVGPTGLGAMRSAPAVGALAMALLLSLWPPRKHVGVLMFVSVLLFGLFTILFGLSTHYGWSLFCLAMLGATDMISVVIRTTLVQVLTPEQVRGRVNAVNMVFIGASNELGEFESGLTAAWLGTVPAVVWGGLGTCLVVLLWCLLFPALRKADKMT